jgi:exodeoxyribonuclease VII small subunit
MASQAPVEKMNFEQALGELEEIVRKLESGQAPLEESITAYERGVLLRKHCEKKLNEAKAKIETIGISEDGSPVAAPFTEE